MNPNHQETADVILQALEKPSPKQDRACDEATSWIKRLASRIRDQRRLPDNHKTAREELLIVSCAVGEGYAMRLLSNSFKRQYAKSVGQNLFYPVDKLVKRIESGLPVSDGFLTFMKCHCQWTLLNTVRWHDKSIGHLPSDRLDSLIDEDDLFPSGSTRTDVMIDLRGICHQLRPEVFSFLLLNVLGLTQGTIIEIMGLSPDSCQEFRAEAEQYVSFFRERF